MGEVRNGDQKVQKYLFSEIFYARQEVRKYLYPEIFFTSVNINGRFTYTLFLVWFICHVPLLHKEKAMDRLNVA